MASLKIGGKAPDFSLPGIDGNTHALGSFADEKAIVVMFWCNHCPTVKDYEDRIVQMHKDYAGKGVAFVAINANDEKNYPEDSFDNMVKRAREKGFEFPYLRDESQETARAYDAERTPEIFLLGPDRTLLYHGRIDDNAQNPSAATSHDLRRALDEVLAGKPVSVAETPPVGCTIKWK